MMYLLVHISAYVALAALIGFGLGWSLRRVAALQAHASMQRQLMDLKSRIPLLENSVRNRDQQIARLKDEVESSKEKAAAATSTVQERERWIADRDRTISLLKSDLALLKLPGNAPEPDFGLDHDNGETIHKLEDAIREKERELADLSERLSGAAARLREKDQHIGDLERQVQEMVEGPGSAAELTRRVAELEAQLTLHAERLRESGEMLNDRNRRLADIERERERQDKWLGVLTEQLDTLRESSRRLTAEANEGKEAQLRVRELEGRVAKLQEELSERDRRLAASRFELSTARAMVEDLKGRVAQ